MAAVFPKSMALSSSQRWISRAWLQSAGPSRSAFQDSKRNYMQDTSIPLAKYGGRHTVTMMPGDGIGPEMMGYVKDVFRVAGAPIDFEMAALNPANDSYEDLVNAISSVKRNGCGMKGNIETKMNRPDIKSRNVEMRNELDLFVNVLKCKSQAGIKTRHDNLDVVLIRQNTEGEYAMLEHESVPGVIESLKIITEESTERLCRFAFDYAKANGRKKVTLIHKANIMKLTDGLFLEVCNRVAQDYPEIEHNDMIIDNTCMQLVSNPWQFDVMILTNLYGTIVSNLICGLIGGPGILSGSNYGPRYAVFEPGTRNTGTKLAGTNTANPCAMLNASVDLLEHLHLDEHAQLIRSAINKTINEDKVQTVDLGGQATSMDVVQNIIAHIKKGL
ncbi:hypothetical protein TCAL_00781 [Tigriopus californicus]|uniref:Isopropylmalate dehydrogenase-like domain-containing protein n=1 Tax=Tigriopus californicus TaxID=6832 RepID=A0A553NEY4_TIGCA|nr:isocitrate dehydrogenase [NAD] subunit gamma, mitochondrial-like [Tigriopus californicus]TRY64007.1 hypothetical protein TCAL_00781 [Tigriopus californicus]